MNGFLNLSSLSILQFLNYLELKICLKIRKIDHFVVYAYFFLSKPYSNFLGSNENL